MAANHIKIQLHLTTEGSLQRQACSSIMTCLTFLQKSNLKELGPFFFHFFKVIAILVP